MKTQFTFTKSMALGGLIAILGGLVFIAVQVWRSPEPPTVTVFPKHTYGHANPHVWGDK